MCKASRTSAELDLVDLRGDGPLRMGVPTDVPRAKSQKLARLWSRVFWSHATRPDGIIFRIPAEWRDEYRRVRQGFDKNEAACNGRAY